MIEWALGWNAGAWTGFDATKPDFGTKVGAVATLFMNIELPTAL